VDPELIRTLIRQTLERSAGPPPAGAVICLCAAWCGVCRDYRAVFDEAARTHPSLVFRWIDVEDEADDAGDLDIETFPTLLVSDGNTLLHAGPLNPQAAHLLRLLRNFAP
jgi:thiol-disulfide isomerase/thioredoxin